MFLDGVLNKRLRIELSDARIIVGRLLCTDRDLNLVLAEGEEHGKVETDSTGADGGADSSSSSVGAGDSAGGTVGGGVELRRRIGLTMVPGIHIVSVSCEQRQ